jgi:hypothetical protein
MYDRVKTWYFSLPWYWKIAGIVVLVLLGVLFILSRLGGATGNGPSIAPIIDTAVGIHEDANKKLEIEITERKKEIAVKLNQAAVIDRTTVENRDKILKATTMEELDALQEELGL